MSRRTYYSRIGTRFPIVVLVASLGWSCITNLGIEKRDCWPDTDTSDTIPDETDGDIPIDTSPDLDAVDDDTETDIDDPDGDCIPPDPPWWDSGWTVRWPLMTDAAPADYSYRLVLDSGTVPAASEVAAQCQPSGDDLRIVTRHGGSWTELDRVVQTLTPSSVVVWFPSPGPGGYDHYLYCGSPRATDPPDDPRTVFLWYDDFDRADGDPGIGIEYETSGGGTWEIIGGELQQTGTAAFTVLWVSIAEWTDIEIRYLWKVDAASNPDAGPVLRWHSDGSGYYVERQRNNVILFEEPAHTARDTDPISPPSLDWQEHVSVVLGADVQFWEDGVLYSDWSGASGRGYAGVATFAIGMPFHFDDLRVRMMTDPEPDVGIGAVERPCD